MLGSSRPLVIDIYHDDSEFARAVCNDLKQMEIARRIRLVPLQQWSSQTQLVRPSLIVVETVDERLLQRLRCPEQLLIVPEELSSKLLMRWEGDSLAWRQSSGTRVLQRIKVVADAFHSSRQLQAVRESLLWHNQRVEREHELVEHIFKNALSRNYLDYPHIRTLLTPAAKFNGDLCLIAPGPMGNLYVLMADFTGHGLAPATGALPLSQAFFAMVENSVSVAEMVTEFNYRLNRLLPNEMFCACFMMELSANGQRVTYWNGGMPPALVLGADGEIKQRLKAQHMALGVLDNDAFEAYTATIQTQADDRIAMYTDGVIEMLSQNREFLGGEALERYLMRYSGLDEFDLLVKKLEKFRGAQPLHDDLSLAILQCCPTGLGPEPEQGHVEVLPFTFSTELDAEALQQRDVISSILAVLGRLPSLHAHRTTIYLLLAEAFNNALEHGLLGLDSRIKADPDGFAYYYHLRAVRLAELREGSIAISVRYDHQQHLLHVMVRNSGAAWEWPDVVDDDEAYSTYGRGIELLRQLAEGIEWHDEGREIRFTYCLPPTTKH